MRVIIYDATQFAGSVGISWAWGAPLFKMFGAADVVIRALTWRQAVAAIPLSKPVNEIQIWSHGYPGGFMIGDKHITGKDADDIAMLTRNLALNALVWWRTCATFHGDAGKAFAERWADGLERRVAAHTHNIGFPFHSGLHTLKPGQKPYWSSDEGRGKDGKAKSSSMNAPNTILFSASSFPKEW